MAELKRRHQVTITIGADTPEDVIDVLKQLQYDLSANGLRDIVSGGYTDGYRVQYTEDPEMSGDKYRALLEAWHDAKHDARNAVTP